MVMIIEMITIRSFYSIILWPIPIFISYCLVEPITWSVGVICSSSHLPTAHLLPTYCPPTAYYNLRLSGPSSLLFGRQGEKDARYIYSTRRLVPEVKTAGLSSDWSINKRFFEACSGWFQATYLTPGAIRQVLSPSSLHDIKHKIIKEFF